MARVTLNGNLRTLAGDVASIDIEANNIRALFASLSERFPALEPVLEQGVAVAIDGTIYQDTLLTPIHPGSDVHLLPPIAGG